MLPARTASVGFYEGYRFCPPHGAPQSRSARKVRQGAPTGQGSKGDSGDLTAISGQAARDCHLRCRNVPEASITQANIIEAKTRHDRKSDRGWALATTLRRRSNGTRCASRGLTQAPKHTPGLAKATDSAGRLMIATARRNRLIRCGGSPGSRHTRAVAGHLLDRDQAPSDKDRALPDPSARVASPARTPASLPRCSLLPYRTHTRRIGHKVD
jgi:hypothetical protein